MYKVSFLPFDLCSNWRLDGSLVAAFSQEEAQTAILELNGTELGSRQIEVREDNKVVGSGGGGNSGGGGGSGGGSNNNNNSSTSGVASSATTAVSSTPAPASVNN